MDLSFLPEQVSAIYRLLISTNSLNLVTAGDIYPFSLQTMWISRKHFGDCTRIMEILLLSRFGICGTMATPKLAPTRSETVLSSNPSKTFLG